MKLKLSVVVQGAADRDVVVVVDAAATVGDVARRLARGAGADVTRALTLRVEHPGSRQGQVLDRASALADSRLRSGCRAEVVPVGERRPGDELDDSAAAVVRVVQGPDAGRSFRVPRGMSLIGRDAAAAVCFHDDREVSRRHATLTVDRVITITDLNSANGVLVDGALVRRAEVGSERVQVGTTAFHVEAIAEHGSARAPDEFVRSPRVEPAYGGVPASLPEIPAPTEPPRLPALALLSPLLIGVVLLAVSRQPTALLFVAVSPLIMLGTWLDGRLRARRSRQRARLRFEEQLDALRGQLTAEREREREAREAESPASALVVRAIHSRSALLWTRTPEHPAFLELRFGLGRLPSRSSLPSPPTNPAGDADADDRSSLCALEEEFRDVADVPVLETFRRAGAIGVAGHGMLADDAARALVLQLVGLHSPADLVVTAFVGPEAARAWSWLSWLPHVDSPHSPLSSSGLAADDASAGLLISQLEALLAHRGVGGAGRQYVRSRLAPDASGTRDDGPTANASTPAILVLVTEGSPVECARLVELASLGADHGVHLLWLASSLERLPTVCRTQLIVDAPTGRGLVGYVRHGRTVPLESLELVDLLSTETAARALAPIVDSGARVRDETNLPRTVSFAELYGDDVLDDAASIVRRWRRNDSLVGDWARGEPRSPRGLRAVVGQGADEPFAIDLRMHGPHALVGGTTGSGKSEFLQTWIMGMAAEYAPDRLTFLLVDYKGGSAFAECVGLPHTVGLVTDLTPHLVRRALASLRAELQHRERLLNAKGAKDLLELERRGDPNTPPALVIVVDEFAALSTEVPEFVDGVVDIGQRGRSLGLHLVLATQRPSGVIRDSLRANTNLRVALRVADAADSVDVLGTAIAAGFDPGTPGRAAAAFGSGRVVDFQSAYLGGRTGPDPGRVDIEVHELPLGTGGPWPEAETPVPASVPAPDIERLAIRIRTAAGRCRVATPRRPWLDPLPPCIDLHSLRVRGATAFALGMLDEPARQRQRPYLLDLDAVGNVAVLGASGAGKSAALRAIAAAASREAVSHPLVIHAIDAGGGALAMLEGLPTVSSVVVGGDTERVTRMLAAVAAEAERRAVAFAAARASSLPEYRTVTGVPLARVLMLVDGFPAFRAEHEFRPGGDFDRLLALASAGRQVGIHVVVAADRATVLPSALAASIGERIVLRLPGAAEYAAAGIAGDALTDAPPGRALLRGDECQLGVPGGAPDLLTQAAAIDELATRLRRRGVSDSAPIERLSEAIEADDLPPSVAGRPTFGVSYDALAGVGLPMGGLFVVTGPFGSGRTTAMTTAIRSVCRSYPDRRLFLLAVRPSPLGDATAWTESSHDPDATAALAARLSAELDALRGASEALTPVIVVEGVGDFEGLAAEAQVVALLRAARRAGATVLVEADTVTAPAAWQLFAELKTARAGIVLQPEESDGSALFRTPLPRVPRADLPPGRGFLVEAGRVVRMQVALPPTASVPRTASPEQPKSTQALQALSDRTGCS